MLYFTYKTRLKGSDKFYVGRHSTTDIEDGYFGSGSWPRSIKDKSLLYKDILEYFDDHETLVLAEQKLLDEYFGTENCMNFNNRAIGFGSGEYNPAKSEKERARRSEETWLKTERGREYMRNQNPSTRSEVKLMRSEKTTEQWAEGSHNFQRADVIEKRLETLAIRMVENNPARMPHVRIMAAERNAKVVSEGKHNFQRADVRAKSKETQRIKRATDPNWGKLSEEGRKTISDRMLTNNPMNSQENRDKISKTKSGTIGLFLNGKKKMAHKGSDKWFELLEQGYLPKK